MTYNVFGGTLNLTQSIILVRVRLDRGLARILSGGVHFFPQKS